MVKKNLWVVEPETEEEIEAVNKLLLKMRKEEERKKKIQFHNWLHMPYLIVILL